MRRQAVAMTVVGLLGLALGATGMGLLQAPAQAQGTPTRAHLVGVFFDTVRQVQRRHVAPVSEERLVHAGLRAMLTSLDGRSDYLNPATVSPRTGPPSTSLGTVGVLTFDEPNGARIYALAEAGPAALGGVEVGDRIIAVDGRGVVGAPRGEVERRLQGPIGSPVKLLLSRKDGRIEVPLVRAGLPPDRFQARLEGQIGYIRIGQFDPGTERQASQALAGFWADAPALKGLILDLRASPGGRLDTATALLDMFLDAGPLYQVTARDANGLQTLRARSGDLMRGSPMVVLVDQATMSGAEVVAAVLQERGRAQVAGLRSFGNGTVQSMIPMNGGAAGAITLTTGLVRTAGGRQLQKAGVIPDLLVANSREEAERVQAGPHATPEAARPFALGKTPDKTAAPEAPPEGFDAKAGDFQLTRARTLIEAAAAAR